MSIHSLLPRYRWCCFSKRLPITRPLNGGRRKWANKFACPNGRINLYRLDSENCQGRTKTMRFIQQTYSSRRPVFIARSFCYFCRHKSKAKQLSTAEYRLDLCVLYAFRTEILNKRFLIVYEPFLRSAKGIRWLAENPFFPITDTN